MRLTHFFSFLLALILASSVMSSCLKEQEADINGLKEQFSELEGRVKDLEGQVGNINETLGQLSVLAGAVENNFYITNVVKTEEGYDLTLSNGGKLFLMFGEGNTLIPRSSLGMTRINGFFYWTLNGMLLTGSDGLPIRSSGFTPIVKYDFSLQQYVISIDGGVTFQSIEVFSSLVINDTVLMQVINSFFAEYSSTLVNQQMLYQVVSTYIQQHYSELFNVELLDKVVAGYIRDNYTRIFNYELLEQVFTQYDFEYYTSKIKVNKLVDMIVKFIKQHKEIFEDNEVLFEIISNYISANKTKLFSSEMLLEIINDFIDTHENYINEDLLTRVVTNYIDQHRDTVFNTESVRQILMEYVQKYYVQVFNQNILVQALSRHLSENSSTIFDETLIRSIIDKYVQNNYTSVFSEDVISQIINNYLEINQTSVLNKKLLIDVISTYFAKNYNIFIDREVIINEFNNYIEKHKTTIISKDIIESIISSYLRTYYYEVFSYDMLSSVIHNYFSENTQVIKDYVETNSDVVRDISVSDDRCTVTLSNGEKVSLVVYDAYARLRDRVQSIVILPEENGHVKEEEGLGCGFLHLNYLVTPAYMSYIIQDKYQNDQMSAELIYTDEAGKIKTMDVFELFGEDGGKLYIHQMTDTFGAAKTVALHIKESKTAGTDIMTEFTPVDSKPAEVKLKISHVDFPAEWGDDFDIIKASIYNSGTKSWTDFRIISDHHGNYSTDPEIILDENDHYVVAWSDLDLDRTDNYIHFEFINGLHYGRSNNVTSSSPNADLSMKPQSTHVAVNVTNYGSDDLAIKGCWLLWTDAHSSSRLATNANLLLLSGELSSINYTSYYRKILSKSYTVKPGSTYFFDFDIIPLSGVGSGVLTVQLVLDNGDEILKDAYELLSGLPGGSLGWSAGDKIQIPFYKKEKATSGTENGHEWVDLGLSVKWATCNVGATKPEGYGDYFAWGETIPYYKEGHAQDNPCKNWKNYYSGYNWKSYYYSDDSGKFFSRYCPAEKSDRWSGFGDPDNVFEFKDYDYEDDAARANWGGSWRTPSYEDWISLGNNCTIVWSTLNGIKGFLVTSKVSGYTDKSIFLPAAGYRTYTDINYFGEQANYWSSSLKYVDSANGYYFTSSGGKGGFFGARFHGDTVRPVLK